MAPHTQRNPQRSNAPTLPARPAPVLNIVAAKPAKASLQSLLLANTGPIDLHRSPIAAHKPADTARHYQQAVAALRAGNPRLALELITLACVGADVPCEHHRLLAEILNLCGKRDAALRTARLAVARDGRYAPAWETLAAILAEQRAFGESRGCYETAVALDPNLIESWHSLANVLQMLGLMHDAELHYRQVLTRAPDHVVARTNYACLLLAQGRYDDAAATVYDVVRRNPAFAKAYVVASAIEYNRGHYQPALAWIDRAIALAAGDVRLLTRRAEILCKLGQFEASLADCNTVLARFPGDAEALRAKAFTLRTLQRPEDALVALRAAQATCSDPDVVVDEAWLLAEMGRKDDALAVIDRALAVRPDMASALYSWALLARRTPDAPHVAAMERVAADVHASRRDRMRLAFALGKIHLEAGDGEKAFAHLNVANAMKRADISYDRATEEQWFGVLRALFSPENLSRFARSGPRTAAPIFVFGMPRSGTTLVEQILASHPLVAGKGEMPHMNAIAKPLVERGLDGLNADNLRACADRYLAQIGAGAPGHVHFVDKTPSNFLYAGLISLLLPGAKMIHCRRDAADTCLSIYSLLFTNGLEYAYDQSELGHYYGQYARLMVHWRAVLPATALLDVDYETLVSDAERETRRLLEFCDLPWDDACLRFYETKRLVTTSSLDQVRTPMYRSSVNRAETFRPWLGALAKSLDENAGSGS